MKYFSVLKSLLQIYNKFWKCKIDLNQNNSAQHPNYAEIRIVNDVYWKRLNNQFSTNRLKFNFFYTKLFLDSRDKWIGELNFGYGICCFFRPFSIRLQNNIFDVSKFWFERPPTKLHISHDFSCDECYTMFVVTLFTHTKFRVMN